MNTRTPADAKEKLRGVVSRTRAQRKPDSRPPLPQDRRQ
jgi:hypothetical protein